MDAFLNALVFALPRFWRAWHKRGLSLCAEQVGPGAGSGAGLPGVAQASLALECSKQSSH